MKPFAFKKSAEMSARLTEELSAEEMAAAKGAGGKTITYVYKCFEMCSDAGCAEVCYYDPVDEV
jgi:hypothetical protein